MNMFFKKETILAIAIMLIFVFFVGYGIEVFSPTPDQQTFCPNVYEIRTQVECEQADGTWTIQDNPEPKIVGYCNNKSTCYNDYDIAKSKHDMIVFIIAILIGVISLVGGIMLKKELISTSIVGGAILLILYGTIRYGQHANNILKFILLGVALATVIWVAYNKIK